VNRGCFSQITGNEEIKKRLAVMLSKGALGQALLFAGAEGVGKSVFALALAAALIAPADGDLELRQRVLTAQHPDLHVYRPEGKLGLHTLESLRQLSREVYLPPYEAPLKIFILHEAERMLTYSANALLKTFEEPPPRTLFILLSDAPAAILPTILSRCYALHFRPIDPFLISNFLQRRYPSLDEATRVQIVRRSEGSIGRAVRLAEQGDALWIHLQRLLVQGPIRNYRLFQEQVKLLTGKIEEVKKQSEEAVRRELGKIEREHQLSVHQQRALEKEMEASASLAFFREAKRVFEGILSWYRDMQWLHCGGHVQGLIHSDCYAQLEQAVQRGESQPLELVWKWVEEALAAIQQSTPLSLCVENLFLKLNQAGRRS